MFETLFVYPKILGRHQRGPEAAGRERYLKHCADQGVARETLLRIARELLVVAERLDLSADKPVGLKEVEAAAWNWARHQRTRRRADRGVWSRRLFISLRNPHRRRTQRPESRCPSPLVGGEACEPPFHPSHHRHPSSARWRRHQHD